MKESQFQNYIVRVARESGWWIHHTRTALAKSGRYMTPVQGHIGFPDLVLVHTQTPILVFAELKTKTGQIRPGQRRWLELLARIDGIYICLWKPQMLEDIERFLVELTASPPGIISSETVSEGSE